LPSTEVLLVKKEVLKLNPDHKSGDDEESNVTPCIPVNVGDIKADNDVQSNVTPLIPLNVKDCQAKATARERTESVSSETSEDLPDLCPIENEVETDDEIPEIVVQIPEQSEAQDLTSDKDVSLFFLTSFDPESEEGEDKSTPGAISPRSTETFHSNSKEIESKLLSDLNTLLELSAVNPEAVANRVEFVHRIANQISCSNGSMDPKLAECAEAELNDCSIISRLDSDHHSDSDSDQGDEYDVFDASMKRLEFIENQFRWVNNSQEEDRCLQIEDKTEASYKECDADAVDRIRALVESGLERGVILQKISEIVQCTDCQHR